MVLSKRRVERSCRASRHSWNPYRSLPRPEAPGRAKDRHAAPRAGSRRSIGTRGPRWPRQRSPERRFRASFSSSTYSFSMTWSFSLSFSRKSISLSPLTRGVSAAGTCLLPAWPNERFLHRVTSVQCPHQQIVTRIESKKRANRGDLPQILSWKCFMDSLPCRNMQRNLVVDDLSSRKRRNSVDSSQAVAYDFARRERSRLSAATPLESFALLLGAMPWTFTGNRNPS